jgi:hypothetical protein
MDARMRIWSRLKEKRIIMVKGEKGGGRGSADLEKVIVAVSLEASRLPYIVVQPPEILHGRHGVNVLQRGSIV